MALVLPGPGFAELILVPRGRAASDSVPGIDTTVWESAVCSLVCGGDWLAARACRAGITSWNGSGAGSGAGTMTPAVTVLASPRFSAEAGFSSGSPPAGSRSFNAARKPRFVPAPAPDDREGANPGDFTAVPGGVASKSARPARSGTEAGAETFTPEQIAEMGPNRGSAAIQRFIKR